MEKVTIGITTYNLEKYIAQALESLLMQKTTFPFSILVVDDASTDTTPSILKQYKEKYPDKIEVIFLKENKGSLHASNTLFNHIKTPYFSFLDGDDYWLNPNRLQKQVDFMESHPEFTLCGGNTLYHKKGKLSSQRIVKKFNTNTAFTFQDYLNEACPFVHTSSLLLRNAIYANGVPDEYIKAEDNMDNLVYRGEDIRFLHHLQKGKLFVFDDDFSVYRIHDKGMWSGASPVTKALEGAIRILRYTNIFPEYKTEFTKKFCAFYQTAMATLYENIRTQYNLSNKETNLLLYLLKILQEYNLKWYITPPPPPKKEKVKIQNFSYVV